MRAGYAEVVKYGLIGDPAFFAWCEVHGEALMAGDGAARRDAIETSVRAKAAIVADDEREITGRRALDRKTGVEGKRVSVRVEAGGRRIIKTNKTQIKHHISIHRI